MAIKVYEYVIVNIEWFGSLDKGTRLYYDYDKQGYVYHYESDKKERNSKYEYVYFESNDYLMSVATVEKYLNSGELVPGPEIGELEYKSKTIDKE
jgi:hypothetical protein